MSQENLNNTPHGDTNTEEIVPVFFTIDESYAPWLAVAIESMKENRNPERHYRVHVIGEDLTENIKKKLESLHEDNFEILFSEMPVNLDMITDEMGNRLRCDYLTLTIYFRIFLPDLFPEYDKAIYLDSDTCIPSDIAGMYDIELGDNYLGVVNDYSIAAVPELQHYVADAVGVPGDRYFNSGILLMNFKKLRERQLGKRFLDLLQTYHFDCIAPDQDYLNALCKDKVVYLDKSYDSMPCQEEALENPKIIHYNLFDKPWCYDNIQYEDYFWDYAKRSGFYDEIQEFKKNYPEERKQADLAAMALLVERGAIIPDQEVTMKKIFESKTEERL